MKTNNLPNIEMKEHIPINYSIIEFCKLEQLYWRYLKYLGHLQTQPTTNFTLSKVLSNKIESERKTKNSKKFHFESDGENNLSWFEIKMKEAQANFQFHFIQKMRSSYTAFGKCSEE